MITLKHLTVKHFRLLRHMDLHFPSHGSILIQGPNEAGKSALLEGIYFALYGELLQSDFDKRSLDELVSYGAADAVVTLVLSGNGTDLTITRTLERGKGQRVTLTIHRPDFSADETLTRLGAVNERILAELGRMDGNALRNSYLIEQKGLDRLEHLRGKERETTVRKLLGLERLLRIGEQFKLTPSDERQREDVTQRLRLAEIQERIPTQSKQLETLEVALDVVSVAEDLVFISQQEADITEQEVSLESIVTHRGELKSKQSRIQQLKRAEATLSQIIHAYDEMSQARLEMPLLERQIAELERREQEELPALEKRVADLVELTKSFGTLQRMSNDLLTSVDSIKELEQDLKRQGEVEDDLKGIDIEVEHARRHMEQAQQALDEQIERQRVGRPTLEARLANLKLLATRLGELRRIEEQYAQHLTDKQRVDESEPQLKKLQRDLQDTEQELTLVENEARQVQQQAEALERRERQLSVRRQLEEWQRLKGLSQGLTDAEQHVRAAYDSQAQLTEAAAQARRNSTKFMGIVVACVVLFVLALGGAIVEFAQQAPIVGTLLGILALLLAAGAGFSFQNYTKARAEEQRIDSQVQEAISRVRMMVAAREAASRMGGNNEALEQVERELRTLTGTIPRSIEEAQALLQQTQAPQDASIATLQEQVKEKRNEANAAQNQVNVTMEAVASLRKQYMQLEDQRNNVASIEEQLREDQMALGRMHQEIILLAGQENLPQPSVNERLRTSSSTFDAYAAVPLTPVLWNEEESESGIPSLDALVENTIKATEHEIASLDGKTDLIAELTNQVKIHQNALDVMLTRRGIVEERNARYQTNNPKLQIERAREQQNDLRSALQSLQDSLRQRVKPMGIAFGQTAIANAEAAARKDLEQLNTILGDKFALQDQHATYAALLKEHQESLAEHYKQLAKFSNSLGSWIVPSNPFADVLVTLRTRCQKELEEANEDAIAKELERLTAQEGASNAKIALCQQEIEDAQERIAAMLIKRNRPPTQHYTFTHVIAVWPLVADYTPQDRERLEQEREQVERDLESLEQQELTLSTNLQTGGVKLNLALARTRMEQQERSYQVKSHSGLLIQAVQNRLMSKIVPRTEYYMQHILPLLTSGRYHDVRVSTYAEEDTISGGPLQLKVWDSGAGEYVNKSALSGGVSDQLSLALRLAFALATLPKEQEMATSFLCLDEPLSSFDRGRTQALMDVLTDNMLKQRFEQILLISHSSAFDPALFNYHVYMENGTVVESNLPVVETSATSTEEEPIDSQREDVQDDMTVHVSAVMPTKVAAE
jgi:DNA repair exonuclease SbcCD ATPase subunit